MSIGLLLRGVGGDGFDPLDLEELKIFVNADGDMTLDGEEITELGDLDPGLVQFSQVLLTPRRPILIADDEGKPAIGFTAADQQFMLSPSLSFGGSFSMFAVGHSSADNSVFWAHPNDPPVPDEEKVWLGVRDGLPAGVVSSVARNAGGGELSQVADPDVGTGSVYRLLRQECDGTHAGNKIWVRGLDTFAPTFQGNAEDPFSSVSGPVILGAFLGEATGGSFYVDGRIRSYALCFPRLPPAVSRNFERYMIRRWGPIT